MYFETRGKVNTEQALERVRIRGTALGANERVVSSTTGTSVRKAVE